MLKTLNYPGFSLNLTLNSAHLADKVAIKTDNIKICFIL